MVAPVPGEARARRAAPAVVAAPSLGAGGAARVLVLVLMQLLAPLVAEVRRAGVGEPRPEGPRVEPVAPPVLLARAA